MIVQESIPNGRTRTYSDLGMRIRQLETGEEYEEAIDSVPHTYVETEKKIEVEPPSVEAKAEAFDILIGGAE